MSFSEDVESISDILKDNLAAGFPTSDVHRKLTLWPGPVPIVDGPLRRTFCGGTKKEDAKFLIKDDDSTIIQYKKTCHNYEYPNTEQQ